ncbi:ABC transporter ATP-binding protein [Ureaplasma diversum]|uniref:ABC transporter ATP-binding protein n=1 Tax=Ureaplasma diversum TaxID=42094 RepID=A0A0C5RB27_9BACT|nr:ABC transporter ATP-binding protein [Ureaplasma diversum]AJQ45131.1 ABC transporter ATP-binding protein [Ureaplasma diversum]
MDLQDLKVHKNALKWSLIRFYFKDFKKYFLTVSFVIIAFQLLQIASIFLLQYTIQAFSNQTKPLETILHIAAGIIGVYFFQCLINVFTNLCTNKLGYLIEAKMSLLVVSKLRYLSMKFLDQNSAGDIYAHMSDDALSIHLGVMGFYAEANKMVFGSIGFGIALLVVSPYLALIGLAVYGTLMCLNILLYKRSRTWNEYKRADFVVMNNFIEEAISAHAAIDNFSQQKYFTDKFDRINSGVYKNVMRSTVVAQMMFPWSIFAMRLLNAALTVSFLLLSIAKIPLPGITPNIDPVTGQVAFGILVSLSLLSNTFAEFFTNFNNTIPGFIAARTSLLKINEIMKVDHEVNWNKTLDVSKFKDGIDIKFDQVCFNYLPNQPTLMNISFEAKAHQKVAIIGPTGAGKTTITNLITKFYDYQTGDITFNNQSIKEISRESVRSQISSVLQDSYLFNESVLDNIKRGKPDATYLEVVQAAMKAQAHELIKSLPNGYHTIIGDKQNLSQGQKQLICIARAIISDAKIIILDEATSSVDTSTELKIQKAIDHLMHERTAIVIAHRLSTIINSDLILIIQSGQIVASGTHNELLKNSQIYQDLYYANYKKQNLKF